MMIIFRAFAMPVFAVLLLTGCASLQGIKSGGLGSKLEVNKRADVHVRLGVSYLELNQLEVAQTEIRAALKINPNYPPANHAMALLNERLNRPKQANDSYKKAVSRDSENYLINLDYGRYLCASNRVGDGIVQYNLALANPLNQQLASTFNGAGSCYLRNRQWNRAEAYFERALKVSPRSAQALYSMVLVHYQLGEMLAARAFLERYTATSAPNAELLLYGVRIEQQMGDNRAAGEYAKTLKRRFPNSREARELIPAQPLRPASS